ELLPAAIEAHYAGLPLILVTADRPARFRGTGAPQAIEQVGLFGVYASWPRGPRHINIEFDEPLIDGSLGGEPRPCRTDNPVCPVPPASCRTDNPVCPVPPPEDRQDCLSYMACERPLVIVGGLHARDRERVRAFALQLNAPVYAEPLSGLREDSELPLIVSGERMIARGNFDGVIRIGNVPTLRFWRDLESSDLPVVHFSALPFAGLTRGDVHPIDALPDVAPRERDEAFFVRDRELAARFAQILDDEPQSELAMFRKLSAGIAENARVYIGNSLPIREWDLAASREPRGLTFEANRGANGIDGQLSTFFGQCDPARENVCVVGDLTAIYDLNAPWIVPQLDAGVRFRIVIVNNGGGRIFSRVASLRALDRGYREQVIENAHDVRFEHFAKLWNIDVEELRPDLDASNRVWARYDELWS
ncbi:MAG TPA: hypothetical protein VF698_10050, partial [Thermoanaerobaculia bacterium]